MAESQQFRVNPRSRRDQLANAGASLLFIGAIALAFQLEPWIRTRLGYAIGATLALFLVWVFVREVQLMCGGRSAPVVIDERGVRYASPGEIAWSEVAGIEQIPAMQRVDLLDAQGRARVSLRYDLEEAGALLQFVADVLASRWPSKPLPLEFIYRMPVRLVVAGGTALALLGGLAWFAYWLGGHEMIETLCVGTIAVILLIHFAIWNSSIRRLTIAAADIVVVKGLRQQARRYPEIAAVALVLAQRGKGERYLDVRIKLRDRTALSVLPRRADPFEVYATLKRAWQQGCAAAAAMPSIPASAA
ncbi:MAG TPA: hypothetical protein VFB33_15400 [Candidatus Binataceae bacterium]|nr:hypothetical protein [Candidatus Binataceae bacterium]